MVNLAIVISIAEYSGELKRLPGCYKDGEVMAEVLSKSNKFDDILVISNSGGKNSATASKEVKSRLVEFIGFHKEKDVGEIFFYFSGHGEYSDNEFYYLLGDYQSTQKNRTSLQNSELDNLVRSLNPQLFVKVVDACHSGISYIKNSGELEKQFSEMKASFKKIYFMFSSQSDQVSWQTSNLSHFTGSFLKSLIVEGDGRVRYKDIADFISDDFELAGMQTPLFIVQADFVELFLNSTHEIKDIVLKYGVGTGHVGKAEGTIATVQSLVAAIKNDAKRYSSKDEAMEILEFLPQHLKMASLSPDLSELFTIRVEEFDKAVPEARSIGNWLEKNKGDVHYFATVQKEMRKVLRVAPKRLGSTHFGLRNLEPGIASPPGQIETYEVEEPYVRGYMHTVAVPYQYIVIKLEPQMPNLMPVDYYIAPILSMTQLKLFHGGCHYEHVDWDTRKRQGGMEWSTVEAPIKDKEAVTDALNKVIEKFISYVETPIRVKWSDQPPPSLTALASAPDRKVQEVAQKGS